MRLLLSEDIPLRTSAMLGRVAENFVLAHRIGDLTSGRFKLGRLDDSTFFAADHAMTMTKMFIEDQETKGWEQQTRSDSVGNTWTVVRFSAPVPAGVLVSGCGTGKRNPRTNALIENPADVAEYVMRLAGRSDAWWDQLRAESAAEGLRLASSIDTVQSIRATLDSVLASAGAIWCPGMARLYPTSTIAGYIAQLDVQKVKTVVATANLDNTCDILRIHYDPDAAGDNTQHFVELTANPMLYGGVVRDETLPWLRTPGNAESVGRRMLQWFGGVRWDLAFPCADRKVRAGQWTKLISIPNWQLAGDPTAMVLEVTPDDETNTVECNGVALLSVPTVTVTAHSVALAATREAGVEVAVKGGVVTLTPVDADGKPIPDATVSLDGGPAKKTGVDGSVSFAIKTSTPPKEHRLAMKAPGKVATVQTILL